MPTALTALLGLFAAALVNRAADCWLSPAPAACGLTRHPRRQTAVLVALPLLFVYLADRGGDVRGPPPAMLFAAVLVPLAGGGLGAGPFPPTTLGARGCGWHSGGARLVTKKKSELRHAGGREGR